jgi:hypothetical protein
MKSLFEGWERMKEEAGETNGEVERKIVERM